MSQKIIVSVDRMGNTKVEAEGFTGGACTDATAAIEQALAGAPGGVERTYKDSWYESQGQHEEQKVGW